MPTGGIRGVSLVWATKTVKLKVNSLNGYSIEFPINFMLKPRRNGRYILGEKLTAMNVSSWRLNEETRKTTERSLSRAGLVGLVGLSRPNWVGSLFCFCFCFPFNS
jgi:hypothetical protein